MLPNFVIITLLGSLVGVGFGVEVGARVVCGEHGVGICVEV